MKRALIVVAIVTLAGASGYAWQQRSAAPPAQAGAAKPAAAMANPLTSSLKVGYEEYRGDIAKAAEQMAEADYAFKPAGTAPEVRTFGQLIGHLADANAALCAAASGMPAPASIKDIEHTKKTKADLQKALNEALTFCDRAWAGTTDANAAKAVDLPFGLGKSTRLGALAFNSGHDGEHYGNIVTYMRAKGLVPPSSQPKK